MARPDDLHPAGRAAEPSLAWLGKRVVATTLADIWATGEIDRALADLLRSGPSVGLIAAPVDDPLLGARIAIVSVAGGGTPIALAEPSREGRLAATLARHGEGPAGRYVRSPIELDALPDLAVAAGLSVSRPATGPFGPAVLLVAAVGGPHLILVGPSPSSAEPAAVPSPP